MTLTRYRAHAACIVAGLILGAAGTSVVGADDGGSHGLAAKGCVHITTSATVCDEAAKRVCNRVDVRVAALELEIGDVVTPTAALQAEECRKVQKPESPA
jgi:hypothetical protein